MEMISEKNKETQLSSVGFSNAPINDHKAPIDMASAYQIGRYIFRPDLKSLLQSGAADIKLTGKETKILCYLLRFRGQAISRKDLLKHVWGYSENVISHTVETHIYRLRQKMKTAESPANLVVTQSDGYAIY